MANASSLDKVRLLRSRLDEIPPGAITDVRQIEEALAGCWHDFDGSSDNGMGGYKLIGRMENASWQSPLLCFTIERHGGTVLGSSRAELQHWEVDFNTRTAVCVGIGYRQLRPTEPPLRQKDLQKIAQELAALLVDGGLDGRIIWKGPDTVRIDVAQIIPRLGAKMTFEGRRKRFRQILESTMLAIGWEHAGRYIFKRGTADKNISD